MGWSNVGYTAEYVPFSGVETSIPLTSDSTEELFVERTLSIFPSEAYLGDSLYLLHYDVNKSDSPLIGLMDLPYSLSVGFHDVIITSEHSEHSYEYVFEKQSNRFGDARPAHAPGRLLPGERKSGFYTIIDLPPLEDWEDPFWKDIREKTTPEGIVCTLSFRISIGRLALENDSNNVPSSPYKKKLTTSEKVSVSFVIKPRPSDELSLLEEWYKATPKESFPVRKGNFKVPSNGSVIDCSDESRIKIGENRFSPWTMVRNGNRKPSDPNNPTTLEGWRELEAQLSPSTMRDEIRLTRLLLDFYSAKDEESSEYWKSELMHWLSTLPESQRTVYVGWACRVVVGVMQEQKEWETKSLKLFASLYEIAGDGTKLAHEAFYREVMKPSR